MRKLLQQWLTWIMGLLGIHTMPEVAKVETAVQSDDHALYKPKQRLIYRYFDGEKVVKVDPMAVYRKVMDVGPELDADIALWNSPSNAAVKGLDGIIDKVRKIFDLKPFEQGGLTDVEASQLLDHFLVYVGWSKKNTVTSPNSSSPTPDSPPSTSPDAQPTDNISDSGSADDGGTTEPPEPSPSA